MNSHVDAPSYLSGEYQVVIKRRGQGIDHYLSVVDPAGRSSEQKVLWTYSMTPFQVAEAAVAKHIGQEAWQPAAETRDDQVGGYIVTVD